MAEPFHGAKRRAQIVRDGIGERLELLVPLLELPGARPHPPLKPLLRLPHVGDHHVERARQAAERVPARTTSTGGGGAGRLKSVQMSPAVLPMNRWASEPISRFNRSFCCRVSADAATRRHCTTYPRKRPALMTGTATPYTIESPTARN